MRALIVVPILAFATFSVQAAQCTGASAGVRTGRSFQIYSGTTPQVYRVCKGEPLRAGDCDVEIRNESDTLLATLEKQPLNGCACTDVEGKKIIISPVPTAGSSCPGASATIWFNNLSGDAPR